MITDTTARCGSATYRPWIPVAVRFSRPLRRSACPPSVSTAVRPCGTGPGGSRSTRVRTASACRPRTPTSTRSWAAAEPRDPYWLLGAGDRLRRDDRHRCPLPASRSDRVRRRRRTPRGHRHGGRDRHPQVADALGYRPGGATPRVRDRRPRRPPGCRREPRRPRGGARVLGGGEADGHQLEPMVGDRVVRDHRAGPPAAGRDDALRQRPVRHEHPAVGIPDHRQRVLPHTECHPGTVTRDGQAAQP